MELGPGTTDPGATDHPAGPSGATEPGVDSLSFGDLRGSTGSWSSGPGPLVQAQPGVRSSPDASPMPPPPDNLPYDYQPGSPDPEPLIKLRPVASVSAHRKWWIASAAFFVLTLAYVMFGTQTAIGRHFELFYMHFSFILATALGAVGMWRWRSYYGGRRGGYW